MMRNSAALALSLLLGLGMAGPATAQGTAKPTPPPGAAQPPTAWPEPLRGTWVLGECAAPAVLLQVNARGIARLPEAGEQRYTRTLRFATAGDWLVGYGEGEAAPRLMLRARDGGIDLAEPASKLLDSELPGAATPVAGFRRCPSIGGALAALHGEGLVFAAALDGLEAACEGERGNSDGCIQAVMAYADVSRDGKLGVAEMARLVRAVTWLILTTEGAPLEVVAAGVGAGSVGGLAVGWLMIASYDYDGDGRLAPAELMQDRGPWDGGPTPSAPPAAASLTQGLGVLAGPGGPLQELIQTLAPYLSGLARQ